MPTVPTNPFKQALRGDRELLGCWLSSGSANIAELCGYSAFDWFLVDGEHGCNSVPTIQDQVRALECAGATAIVRPPANDRVVIKQILDTGARNLLVPMVNTADEARAAVASVRYPTAGARGVGAAIARASHWGRYTDYFANASDQICLLVQVETKQAVDNLDEILAVEGIDGVFIGPVDLGASLGTPPPDELDALVAELIGRINAAGLASGSLSFDTATARRYLDAGARFMACGSETDLLVRALDACLDP